MAHRILYLIDSLGVGGAERGLCLTLRDLDPQRVKAEVAYLFEPSQLGAEVRATGVPLHRIGARPGIATLASIPRVEQLLRSGRFDAIHTQLLWASIVGRVAGKRSNVKVISHIANASAGGFAREGLDRGIAVKANLLAKLDEWTGNRYADRFVAISQAVKADPVRGRSWDRSRISVVLRGQDLEDLRASAKRPVSPPIEDPGAPCILTIGRLSEQKGQRFLVDAMEPTLRTNPRARLLICGDGHLRDELRRRAERFGDRVAFLGIREDVPALLTLADVFCFPSLWEGQGNALLEAMAVGAPIVATDIPSTRETLRDQVQALLVPPADARALAEAIGRLAADRGLARRLADAASRRAEDFDIARTTRDLEDVYDEVLGAG